MTITYGFVFYLAPVAAASIFLCLLFKQGFVWMLQASSSALWALSCAIQVGCKEYVDTYRKLMPKS